MPNVLHFRPTITRVGHKISNRPVMPQAGEYAESLQRIIEQNGLQQYDKLVMQEMETQGKRVRYGT